MATQIVCDCCQTPLTPTNWFLDGEICNDCALLAQAAGVVGERAVIRRRSPQSTAEQWAAVYSRS